MFRFRGQGNARGIVGARKSAGTSLPSQITRELNPWLPSDSPHIRTRRPSADAVGLHSLHLSLPNLLCGRSGRSSPTACAGGEEITGKMGAEAEVEMCQVRGRDARR